MTQKLLDIPSPSEFPVVRDEKLCNFRGPGRIYSNLHFFSVSLGMEFGSTSLTNAQKICMWSCRCRRRATPCEIIVAVSRDLLATPPSTGCFHGQNKPLNLWHVASFLKTEKYPTPLKKPSTSMSFMSMNHCVTTRRNFSQFCVVETTSRQSIISTMFPPTFVFWMRKAHLSLTKLHATLMAFGRLTMHRHKLIC